MHETVEISSKSLGVIGHNTIMIIRIIGVWMFSTKLFLGYFHCTLHLKCLLFVCKS